jgi:hypothetical protein
MCRTKQQIETDLSTLEEVMFTAKSGTPQWDEMVKRRNNLIIELRQAEKPVEKQKTTHLSNLKFIR